MRKKFLKLWGSFQGKFPEKQIRNNKLLHNTLEGGLFLYLIVVSMFRHLALSELWESFTLGMRFGRGDRAVSEEVNVLFISPTRTKCHVRRSPKMELAGLA